MRKDSPKKKDHIRRLVLGSAALVVLICAVFLIFQYKQKNLSTLFPTYFMRASSFISERRENLQRELVKAKQLAEKNNTDMSIHFEFYNTLPNMQVTINNDNTEKDNQKELAPTANKVSLELDHALSTEISKNRYVIQLGVFHHLNAAERYRQAVSDAGIKVMIVKIRLGQEDVYRVQQGPFSDKNQAKLAKKMLQKRGISSILRTQ